MERRGDRCRAVWRVGAADVEQVRSARATSAVVGEQHGAGAAGVKQVRPT
uniref:Uncharacterized protein n=1 Tax=Cucumis melo TaxID=3656 RepID=A0A9I9CYT0_CUCME